MCPLSFFDNHCRFDLFFLIPIGVKLGSDEGVGRREEEDRERGLIDWGDREDDTIKGHYASDTRSQSEIGRAHV